MRRASTLSLASLCALLGTTTACQDLTGKCSNRTDTVCLQIVADRSTAIDDVKLTVSTGAKSHDFDFPNIAAQLAARPYVVEVEFDNPLPATLSISAAGNLTDPVTKQPRQVAAGQLMLSPATAARPTQIVLVGTDGSDLGQPSGDMATGTSGDGGTPADLQGAPWAMVYAAPGKPLNGVFGIKAGTTAIYAVGNSGFVARGNGTSFAPVTAAGTGTLTGVWVSTANFAVACDQLGIAYRTGDGGTSWMASSPAGFSLSAIYGRSTAAVLAVGASNTAAFEWDGTNWKSAAHNLGAPFTGVFASTAYYYGLGGSGIGGRAAMPAVVWTSITNGSAASSQWAIAGLGTTDTFTVAVSGSGVAQYISGMISTTWTSMASPVTTALSAVWVPSDKNAFVGGVGGIVYQYNNGIWTKISNGNLNGYDITGLWGDGAGGLWASARNGTSGAIFKY